MKTMCENIQLNANCNMIDLFHGVLRATLDIKTSDSM